MTLDAPREGFAVLERLMRLRRDVRHFSAQAVAESDLADALRLAGLAPSVGYSQPWRWVRVEDPARRAAVVASHERANARARDERHAARAGEYAALKLSGLAEAPLHLAVFCDRATPVGEGLGRHTMAQTLQYSVVMAIYGFWLAARARGIGVGWVSILEPEVVTRLLDVPAAWELVAYLAVGHAAFDSETPELAERGWERPYEPAAEVHVR